MLNNLFCLKCDAKDKSSQFSCEMDTPLETVKEMLFQILKHVGQLEDQAREYQAQQQAAAIEASQEKQEEVA